VSLKIFFERVSKGLLISTSVHGDIVFLRKSGTRALFRRAACALVGRCASFAQTMKRERLESDWWQVITEKGDR